MRLWTPLQTFDVWKLLLLLSAAALGYLAFADFQHPSTLTSWLWSSESTPWWQSDAAAAVTGVLFGGVLAGLLASLWNDAFRCPWLGFRIRRRVRKEPSAVLHPDLGERHAKLVRPQDPLDFVPRSELLDEVLDGVLTRDQKDVQIVVGEPGSGKTTALVELAGVLARIGMLPVVVPLRAKQDAIDLIELAKVQFKSQTERLVRSDGEGELLWRWLCRRRRVAILIDDMDQIGPDGERGYMLRTALEGAASRDLALVVTARPAGVPAGIAASSIELGRLDDARAAACVEHGVRDDPAFGGSTRTSRRMLEDWIREGELADAPFYLELLAHLVAGGVARKLPPADRPSSYAGRDGRSRRTSGGGVRRNPLWVRFLLLERFYEETAAGRVRSWLGIEAGERHSSLVSLEAAALGTLCATGIRAQVRLSARNQTDEEAARLQPRRERIEDFIDTRDRERPAASEGGRGEGACDEEPTRRRRVSAHEIIDTGERLRILDRDPHGELQFRHRIMQAYLAGCRLALIEHERRLHAGEAGWRPASDDGQPDRPWLDWLLDATHPEKLTAHMTLTFAALSAKVESDGAGQNGDVGEERVWREVAESIVDRLLQEARESLRLDEQERFQSTAAIAVRSERVRLTIEMISGEQGTESQREGGLATAADPMESPNPEDRLDPDDALTKLTTAAQIAYAIGYEGGAAKTGERIVETVSDAQFATRWTKLEAIEAIVQLGTEKRWQRIWEFARDPDYFVRQAASSALEDDAFDAYRALSTQISELVVRAALRSADGLSLSRADGGDEERTSSREEDLRQGAAGERPSRNCWSYEDVLQLRALAWIMPVLVSGLREDPATHSLEAWRGRDGTPLEGERPSRSRNERLGRAPEDYLHFPEYVNRARTDFERLVALGFQGGQRGLQEALALGFKGDAMRHAHGGEGILDGVGAEREAGGGPESIAGPGWVAGNRRLLLKACLEHSESWYARLLLAQALALYTIAGASRADALDEFARIVHRGQERHPFTQRGARLARAAVYRARLGAERWHAFIWDDEGPLASRRQAELNSRTSQLVADVTILLDLKEGSAEDRHDPFGTMRQLPYCLGASRDRAEILGKGCPDSCGWGFCPYKQPPPDEPNAQRGVTRAFCREQRRIARRPAWQRRIPKRRMRAFWREMERRART